MPVVVRTAKMEAMNDMTVTDDTGLLLQYPSDDFPATSTFRLWSPAGWSAVATAEALLAVRRDEPVLPVLPVLPVVGGFRPNVLVNVHRLPRTDDPGATIDRLLDGDIGLPSFEVLEDERRERDLSPAHSRLIGYAGPDGLALRARRVMILVPVSAHFVDVVSAIGTWPAAADADTRAEVEKVVGSLVVARPAA